MSDEFEEIVKKYRDGAIYAAGRGHDTVPVNIVVRHIDEMADEIRSAIVERTAEPVGYGYAPEMQSGKGGFWVSWEQSNAYDTPVYSTPPAAPVRAPEGWQLVPKEPTDRMISAGIIAYDGKCETSYRAMLKEAEGIAP